MANISFNEESAYRVSQASSSGSTLGRFVVQLGLAKDERGAKQVLLITVGLCVLLSVGLLFFRGGTPAPETPLDPTWPEGRV